MLLSVALSPVPVTVMLLFISLAMAETENTGLLFGFYKPFNLISSSERIYRARRINNQIITKLHSEATGLGVVTGERKC